MFFLMPLFALLLKLLYRQSERLYLSHFIFALHFHTFVFLVLIARFLIYIITESQLSAVLLVFIPLYLFRGLKRVYSEIFYDICQKFRLVPHLLFNSFMFIIGTDHYYYHVVLRKNGRVRKYYKHI